MTYLEYVNVCLSFLF